MKIETYDDSDYRVSLNFTKETIEQLYNGIKMIYICPFDSKIVIKIYKKDEV